jgi:sirohydrochlorin cobaltochelatase
MTLAPSPDTLVNACALPPGPVPCSGLIVFAHGSRDPQWKAPIERVAQAVRRQSPQTPVLCAYLELCQPDLPAATAQLLAAGVRHVTLVPLFLGMGRHAREDLPSLVTALRHQHPDVVFTLASSVGEDDRLTQLMACLALESLSPNTPLAA